MSRQRVEPQPGPQYDFSACSADIAIIGGAAGGGKTYGLLMEGGRHIDNPKFHAVYFRNTYRQIMEAGGLWDDAADLYPALGGVPNQAKVRYTFPSGAGISFRYMQAESDKYNYRGAQIPLLIFDQLEQFSEAQFFYLLSRNRSVSGVRPYVRASCNPEPNWLADFLAWWINQETGYAIPERAGQIRWMARIQEEIVWTDTREEMLEIHGDYFEGVSEQSEYITPEMLIKSVAFFPATVFDNKILLESDPEYLSNLLMLPYVDRERLLGGNWKVKPEAGKVFNRGWFPIVDAVPAGGVTCRFWDFAATEKKMGKRGADPDYTVGFRMKARGGSFYITDVIAVQMGAIAADKLFKNRTFQDQAMAQRGGARYLARWEREPAAAGKRESVRLAKMLPGVDASGVRPQGEKIQRAKAFAAQAEIGNVFMLRAHWNEQVLDHLHNQPDWPHDDIMDAGSGAFNELAKIVQLDDQEEDVPEFEPRGAGPTRMEKEQEERTQVEAVNAPRQARMRKRIRM